MTLELHLIFVTVELILLVVGVWLYSKWLGQKREPSTSSSAELPPNGYADYLKSNTWEGLRQQAVRRANRQCELCQAPYEVVHHVNHPQTYEEDHLGNLLVVCGSCYGKLHGPRNQQKLAAKKAPPLSQKAVTAAQAPLFNQQAASPSDTRRRNFLQDYGPRVFSEEVIGGGRAFFFDVYSISKQKRTLVIVEDREKGHKRFGYYHLSIPEVSVLDFDRCFRETLDALRVLTTKDKKDLFTKKVVANNGSYFIDAKMASNGRMYLKITESKRKEEDGFERSYIMMFEEDFEPFAAGLKKAASFLLKMNVA